MGRRRVGEPVTVGSNAANNVLRGSVITKYLRSTSYVVVLSLTNRIHGYQVSLYRKGMTRPVRRPSSGMLYTRTAAAASHSNKGGYHAK